MGDPVYPLYIPKAIINFNKNALISIMDYEKYDFYPGRGDKLIEDCIIDCDDDNVTIAGNKVIFLCAFDPVILTSEKEEMLDKEYSGHKIQYSDPKPKWYEKLFWPDTCHLPIISRGWYALKERIPYNLILNKASLAISL